MGVDMQKSMYRLDKVFKCEIMKHNFQTLKLLNQDIDSLSYLYPEIKSWYWNTFAKGFAFHKREIIVARDNFGNLAGFSLLKNCSSEKKICTFFILPEFRESGLGKKLLPVCIDTIGNKQVGITVSETINSSLNSLLLKNNFEIENIESGLYLPNSKEIFYKLD